VATAPTTGGSISPGMGCTISGMAGTYQYAGGTAMLVCTPYGTTTAVTAPTTAATTAPVATAPTTAATTAPAAGAGG
jgi:hypothetical protein